MLALQSNLPLQLFFAHEFEFSHFVMMDGWMDGWMGDFQETTSHPDQTNVIPSLTSLGMAKWLIMLLYNCHS
jgi:hypothetical protein